MKKITPETPTLPVHGARHYHLTPPSDNPKTLASLNVMSTDLAFEFDGSRRNVALAIQQIVVLGKLLVNRALDNLDPPDPVASGVNPTSHH